MKQLENAREYKRLLRKDSTGRRNDTKPIRQSKRLLQMSKIVLESDEQEGLKTPPAFNEFEVLGDAKQKDIEDETVSIGPHQIKVYWQVVSDQSQLMLYQLKYCLTSYTALAE
jgi:hypothetical protein